MYGLTAFKYDCPKVLLKFSLNLHGRSIAQMMIRWFLRAEARVQSVWDLWKAKSHSSGCFSAYFHSVYYFTDDTNPYYFTYHRLYTVIATDSVAKEKCSLSLLKFRKELQGYYLHVMN
jgi:hypothetical protein